MRQRPRRDGVTSETRRSVFARDGGCVALKIDPDAGPCADRWGNEHRWAVLADLTFDHVKDEPGMGFRSEINPATGFRTSDPGHLVTLCGRHHLTSGWATSHRPELRAYLLS